MAKYRITQVVSSNGETKKQKANLAALGIHRMHQSVEVEIPEGDAGKTINGRIEKVRHLVKVEEI